MSRLYVMHHKTTKAPAFIRFHFKVLAIFEVIGIYLESLYSCVSFNFFIAQLVVWKEFRQKFVGAIRFSLAMSYDDW